MQLENRKQWGKLLSLLAVILWTGFIWGNSLVPGPVSMDKSQNVVDAVKPMLDFFQVAANRLQFWVRKAAHFLEFGLLGLLWLWALQYRVNRDWKAFFWGILICFLTAGADEGLQLFSGRTSQFRDVLIDSSGALAGLCIGLGIRLHSRKKV